MHAPRDGLRLPNLAAGAWSLAPWAAGILALALLAVSASGSEPALKLTALANEGVLFRAGETVVAIDAAVREPYSVYGALPAEAFAELAVGEGRFAGLDLLLVSHEHRDHFQAEAMATILAGNAGAMLVSSPQVVESAAEAVAAGDRDRLRAVDPCAAEATEDGRGGEVRLDLDRVRVDFLCMPHGGRHRGRIYNLGHVVEIGGRRVLHIGDVANDRAIFAGFELPSRKIDVVLVPYWMFWGDEEELVRTALAAPVVVAVHIPPGDLAGVREELAERWPEVRVLSPLESIEIP